MGENSKGYILLGAKYNNELVGSVMAIICRDLVGDRYRISPIFILPEYQGKGIAQKVFYLIEEIYHYIKKLETETAKYKNVCELLRGRLFLVTQRLENIE